MNKEEAKCVGKLLVQLMSTANAAQVQLLVEDHFPKYDSARALAVIRTFAANNSMFDMPRLLEGLRADYERHRQRVFDQAHERIVEFIRRDHSSDIRFQSRDDARIISQHFVDCSMEVRKTCSDPSSLNGALTMMKNHAVMALMQIGQREADAREEAAAIIGDIPSAKLEGVFA